MIIVGEVPDLEEIAQAVGVGYGWKLRGGRPGPDLILAPAEQGGRYSIALEADDDPRDVIYRLCQHGHEAFLVELFERHPDVEVRTPLATYQGRQHFHLIQPEIRAKYLKKYGADNCTCPGP